MAISFNNTIFTINFTDGKSSNVQIDAKLNEKDLTVDEGLRLQFPWDSISLARPTLLKEELQKEIVSKLNVCSNIRHKTQG